MSRRDGFSLIEIVIALTLLSVSVLGIQLVAGNMLRRMTAGNVQLAAAQLAEDRVDRIRLEPNYPVLDTFARTETGLGGFPSFTRVTSVMRTVDTTATGIIDYRTVTVRVTAVGMPTTIVRTLVIGSP